ncbi:UDP-4-amino-4,6-dideoxy-N-acetyl-beta-L-altrosamine N-acetyltransferase [Planktomarina temperata]|nr:UDP-4-amino-4,6-dideoxy-N-acetyl-beta-L-altrosamine N-acetyltransferase [Planktomarina temperata]
MNDFSVQVRPMTTQDILLVYNWRNDYRIRRQMFNPKFISEEQHVNWFHQALKDVNIRLLLVSENANPFGFAKFKIIDNSTAAEWGFYVDPKSTKGQGTKLGKSILNYGFNVLRLQEIFGRVLLANEKSMKFHRKFGFQLHHKGVAAADSFNKNQDYVTFRLSIHDWYDQKYFLGNVGNIR